MHAILIPVGSCGDVHPFVGLGLALKKRGHRVTVATNSYFRELIERTGLAFVEISRAEDYLRLSDNPDIWHPRKAMPLLMKEGILPIERPVFDIIKRLHEPGQTVVAAGSLGFGARIAQEKLNVPTAMVHLQPIILWSVEEPPVFPGAAFVQRLPKPLVRGLYWFMNRVCDGLIAPETNKFRAELALPPRGTSWGHGCIPPSSTSASFRNGSLRRGAAGRRIFIRWDFRCSTERDLRKRLRTLRIF